MESRQFLLCVSSGAGHRSSLMCARYGTVYNKYISKSRQREREREKKKEGNGMGNDGEIARILCVFPHKWKRNRPLHSSLRNAALRWRFNLPPSWQMHSCRVSSSFSSPATHCQPQQLLVERGGKCITHVSGIVLQSSSDSVLMSILLWRSQCKLSTNQSLMPVKLTFPFWLFSFFFLFEIKIEILFHLSDPI